MAGVFAVEGFGFPSNYNGAFVTSAAGDAMQAIAGTNANSIELAPRLFTNSVHSNGVFADSGKTESDANILQAIANARAHGLSVSLKPMVSALDGALANSLTPNDPAAFFASYKTEIVHMAQLAQQAGVSMFMIGNELSKLSGPAYHDDWVDIINAVRAVYHGEITYAAATDEAINVSFWNDVDVIGVNAYPPLTTEHNPTVQEMVNAWNTMSTDDYWAKVMDHKSPVDFFHSLALEYGKQVFFTETGYRSADGTNINPGGGSSSTPDAQEQADAFNAFFQVWGSEGGSWFKGASIWNWDADNTYSELGYSPEGKPAQGVITEWYGGERQPPGHTVTGSPAADLIDLGGGNDVLSGGVGNDTIRGGGGNDTITGGPDIIPKLAQTTVTVTGYGSVVDGIGAQMQLLVNGQQVGHTVEFHTATDAAGYQTFTFTFANPATISSLDLAFINDISNAGGDRNLYVKDITVNGAHLSAADAVNPSSPGTWDLYQNKSIHYDMSGHQDLFFGSSTDNDNLDGGPGNDVIHGGAGADVIHGGTGDDTIDGGPGIAGATDQLYGDDGNDIIKAGQGDTGARLDGGAGNDQLYGGAAANVMKGGSGDDRLEGAAGDDILTGGAGNDTFVFKPGFGKDVIADFQNTDSAHDVIQFAHTVFADFSAVESHMAQSGTSVVITVDASNSVEIKNTTLDHLHASDFLFV